MKVKLTGSEIQALNANMEAAINMAETFKLGYAFQKNAEKISKAAKYIGLEVDKIKRKAAQKDATGEIVYEKKPTFTQGEEKMVSCYKYDDAAALEKLLDAALDEKIDVDLHQVTYETVEAAEKDFAKGAKNLIIALHGSVLIINELAELEKEFK